MGWIPSMVPLLVVLELGGVAYVRRNRYPRFLFGLWAPTLYLLALLADLLLAALLTALLGGGGPASGAQQTSLLTGALFAAIAVVGAAVITLFIRWVLHTDITDIPD